MTFYQEMQDLAAGIMAEFKQGLVTLEKTSPGVPDPDRPWEPSPPTVVTYELDAAVRTVESKYVDGTMITAEMKQITFAVPPVVPSMSDRFSVDGVEKAVVDLRAIPGAGTPVAYVAIVAR